MNSRIVPRRSAPPLGICIIGIYALAIGVCGGGRPIIGLHDTYYRPIYHGYQVLISCYFHFHICFLTVGLFCMLSDVHKFINE